MKELAVAVLLLLAGPCAVRGQSPANLGGTGARASIMLHSGEGIANPAPLFSSSSSMPALAPSVPPVPGSEFAANFRWQISVGVDWLRFQSSIFNANAVGTASSLTYFTNEWLAVEGDVTTAFESSTTFGNEHVKLLVYGAGPKIARRGGRWEPWAHVLLGGSHEQPQTAGNSRNAFAVVLGGGTDYRFNPRFSARLEGDWVRTSFFSQSQNNFQLTGGVVLNF